ncbi:MAG: Ig-like domain-containing protein, partial [Candidatus Krumholzibacteriia bacterium]
WSGDVTLFRADETNAKRGNVTIDATLLSNPGTTGISNSFVVKPNSFTRLQIVVPGQTRLPGSIRGLDGAPASQVAGQNFIVDVYATDDWWNPVVRRHHDEHDDGDVKDQVRITSSDPLASTPASARLAAGFWQFTLSLGTVGMQTVTVVDVSDPRIFPMTSDPIPVVSSGAQHFEFGPISGPIVAGDSILVTVRAADAAGNTVTGFNGNGILTANTGPGSISPQGILFTAGVWTGYVIFRGAGASVRVTCADFSAPPHIGVSNSFQVLAGPYAALQVLLPGQTARGGTAPGFIGLPVDQNAGTPFNVTVRAVDRFWNRVSGTGHRVALSSSDEFALMPSDTVLTSGEVVVSATLHKGGSQTITATDADSIGISPYTSSPVFILPGTYSQILLLAPGQAVAPGLPDGRVGTATDQSVNFAFTVTVYAVDRWFNPMTGVTDAVRLTSTDPLAQMPPDTPMIDGRADLSVRLATGGFQLLTATNVTQPSMPVSTAQVKAISSGFHLEATVSPASVVAGEPFSLSVQVTNDAGAVIQEINSFIRVSVQNASTQAPGQGTLLNAQFQLLQGRRTIAETYTFAEPIVLVVSDDAGNAPAITSVVTVGPGAPDRIALSADPAWITGNSQATVTARVVDGFDNGIPTQPIQFQLVSGTGKLTARDTETSVDGVARATFLSPLVPETDRVRATSGAITAELDIETAFVNPNQPPGSVTNYPNPFHPGDAPTTIAYKLSIDAVVTLSIYTLSGGLVFQERFDAGALGGLAGLNEVAWDGRNGSGDFVASGGYIAVLEARGNGETIHSMRRKIAVVR